MQSQYFFFFARNVQRFPCVVHTHKHTYTNTHSHTHIQEYEQVMMGGAAVAPAKATVGKNFCLLLNLLDKITIQLTFGEISSGGKGFGSLEPVQMNTML